MDPPRIKRNQVASCPLPLRRWERRRRENQAKINLHNFTFSLVEGGSWEFVPLVTLDTYIFNFFQKGRQFDMPAKYTGTLVTSLNSKDSPSCGVSSTQLLTGKRFTMNFFINLDHHTYVLSIGGGGNRESPRKYVRNTNIITSMLLGQFDCCSRLFTYINLHISMVLGLRMKTDTNELPTFFVFIVSNTMPLNTGCYFILLSLIRPFRNQ